MVVPHLAISERQKLTYKRKELKQIGWQRCQYRLPSRMRLGPERAPLSLVRLRGEPRRCVRIRHGGAHW